MRWICFVSAMRSPKAKSSSMIARTADAGSTHTSLTRSARSDAVHRASGPASTLDSPSSHPGKQHRTSHEPPDGFSSHTPSRPLFTTKTLREGSPSLTERLAWRERAQRRASAEPRRGSSGTAARLRASEEALERLEARRGSARGACGSASRRRRRAASMSSASAAAFSSDGEIEPIGELARSRFEVPAREGSLAELHLDLAPS